ncbi:hypothetical protein NDU88_000097 [Pleurodeles waltl]|uniref:Uncharacterized protein n=1 Tax=Pleurodeles waltl TaxID=8319 RepID=A0AAV7L5E5_PLEWA|nr:hypothetical protein NDU88_000097 [Pleurodeles waltl]
MKGGLWGPRRGRLLITTVLREALCDTVHTCSFTRKRKPERVTAVITKSSVAGLRGAGVLQSSQVEAPVVEGSSNTGDRHYDNKLASQTEDTYNRRRALPIMIPPSTLPVLRLITTGGRSFKMCSKK